MEMPRFARSVLAIVTALVLALISVPSASADMDEWGYQYRSDCVGAGDPAAQARGFGVIKIRPPGSSYYLEWPSNPNWHTRQAQGTYNGGYWRAVASAQLNYESTFGFCQS